jgi:hypothetical protein
MKTTLIIKKPWIKPFVKVVSVKKDTYGGTRLDKEQLIPENSPIYIERRVS